LCTAGGGRTRGVVLVAVLDGVLDDAVVGRDVDVSVLVSRDDGYFCFASPISYMRN